MPSLKRPTAGTVHAFLAAQAGLDFTYAAVGATASVPPDGFVVDRTRVRIGEGQQTFDAARRRLERWDHFRLGWVEPVPAEPGIHAGLAVAIVFRTAGLWWLNACRIVYVIDDQQDAVRRWGFAYGTLPGHAESGEERFMIEWDQESGGVWYDILAFSRPRNPLARLGYPITRWYQRRFARESASVMR
jgi:uncharacterized protein (UPF0548 family)